MRGTTLLVLGVLAAMATGCGGGEDDRNPPVGVVRSDQLNVLNAVVITDGEGDVGTLVATIVNEAPEADTLTDVEVISEFGDTQTLLPDGPVDLPTDEVVRLAPDLRVVVTGEDLRPGYFVEIAYEFENAPTLRDVIPVDTDTGAFDDIEVPEPGDVSS